MRITVKNSWIFNWKLDLISFVAPFFIAYFFIGTKYNNVNNYWLSFILAKIFIGGGHIFATYIPFMASKKIQHRLNTKLLYVPIIFVGFFALSNFISDIFFMNLLAIVGLMHIYLQHYAWMKMGHQDKWERRFFLTLLIFPNAIWFLNQLENLPSYLYAITITRSIPKLDIFSTGFLVAFSLLATALSFFFSIRRQNSVWVVDFAKLIFFLCTVTWMCVGLFFIKPLGFFHVYLAISHGMSYMAYISLSWPKHLENGIWNSSYRFVTVCAVALLFGLLWVGSFYLFKWTPPSLIFLPWIPLLVHYSYDSILWRKFKTPRVIHE